MKEVKKVSKGLMETNIDSYLQEEESTTGPIKVLVDIQMDPIKPSQVVKVDKGLSGELA